MPLLLFTAVSHAGDAKNSAPEPSENSYSDIDCPDENIADWRSCLFATDKKVLADEKGKFDSVRSAYERYFSEEMDWVTRDSVNDILQTFDSSEKAWARYVELQCNAQSGQAYQSTASPAIFFICRIRLNRDRIELLSRFEIELKR